MKSEIKNKINSCKNIIDLGCGNNPLREAKTAVDYYINPIERSNGDGPVIDENAFKNRGIRFLNARIDSDLPFADKEFDFAYSHHAFEHLEDPAKACEEMMRISQSGVIIAPSFFSELIFGRKYHRWILMQRDNMLLFFRKRDFEYLPFGDGPTRKNVNSKWESNADTNPFDILLNDGDWYKGNEKFDRLAKKIKNLYYSHHPLIETNFLWENKFEYKIYE